ncbi:MAG: DinB family protein [Flavobacteriales bacterium]|nr:DinB family protein [Bacteroidota bacterium]MCB9239586.1 DinB family protein [Flavobacteriales bacterium]
MTKPLAESIPVYYRPYLEGVQSQQVMDALQEELEGFQKLFGKLTAAQLNFSYGPDKWTMRQLWLHLMDTERVMSYRAMRFARGDRTELPGFEQDDYVLAPGLTDRSRKSLMDEWNAVRESTLTLFKSLNADELKREGIANGYVMSVNALGFIIAGHMIHHLKVVRDRYINAPDFP